MEIFSSVNGKVINDMNNTKKMQRDDVKILTKEVAYDGYLKVYKYHLQHRLYNGGESHVIKRECLERGHAVAVLPYDPIQDKVILIEQFRIGAWAQGTEPWLLEIIAGMVEEGETPEQVAIREAQEEANCRFLLPLEKISHYLMSAGGSSEATTIYCGCVQAKGMGGVYGLAQEGEDICVSSVSLEQAKTLLESEKISASSAIIALQWLLLHHDTIRTRWRKLLQSDCN